MHVCTALNAHNDLYTLYSLLFCCIDADDFIALFAEVQRPYGTLVWSGVTYKGVPHCVYVANAYCGCMFHIDGNIISCIGDVVLFDVIDVELLPLTQRRLVPYNSPIPDMASARNELQEVLSLPAPAPHLRTQTLTHRRNGPPCTHLPGVRRWLGRFSVTLGAYAREKQNTSRSRQGM